MSAEDRPYRVAIRGEGKMINAYWTRTGTMDGAELIASIAREVCESSSELWDAFQVLMQATSVELVKLRLNMSVSDIEVTPAAEHERAGRG